ncbi:MAG: AMP-binding protein [Burkholderiaceae bacterium]|nr:AMP-binding protein [Burkholderiaceae bacterium]
MDATLAVAAHTAHVDTFAAEHLPPRDQWPEFLFDLPELQYPARLNCATELLTRALERDWGDRIAIRAPDGLAWTFRELNARANRIACVLVHDMGLVPGNRVLLRGFNTPLMAACWFAVMKAGGIAVATMPLLRARELVPVIGKANVSHALCDARLLDELNAARAQCPMLTEVATFGTDAPHGLDARAARQPPQFDDVDTAADDTALIAFTSGTTGEPKGTMHFHRDVLAICDCWPRSTLRATMNDVFTGSPPLAFTFGLGGLLLFPLRLGACALMLEKAAPDLLLAAIVAHRPTVAFTAPTSYRAMALAQQRSGADVSCLRKCVSAGEALPAATRALWKSVTGIELIDGIGATEMLHIFISHADDDARPGATGKPTPGYRATVLDQDGRELPRNTVGRLAVQGPTGCRYLADARQAQYVQHGWNITGDAYLIDGSPDDARGAIVKAFVVLKAGVAPSEALVKALQEHVKQQLAPYKYPRAIEFMERLPRTETGKLQRFALRQREAERAAERTARGASE